MDKDLILKYSYETGISMVAITQEIFETIILKELTESSLSSFLVFKGGTALRLAYKFPRFSEDLDFSILKKIDHQEFIEICQNLGKKMPELTLKEVALKRYTHFAIFHIRLPFFSQAISLKVEISKRPTKLVKDKDYAFANFFSPFSPFVSTGQVFTLEKIFSEKKKAIYDRVKARDLFDLWYLGLTLKKSVKLPLKRFNYQEAKQELHRFLAKKDQRFLDIIFSQK